MVISVAALIEYARIYGPQTTVMDGESANSVRRLWPDGIARRVRASSHGGGRIIDWERRSMHCT